LKEGLELLYALQQLDNKIKELEISLKDIPEAIKKLEDERDGKASIIENTKEKLNHNAKEREKFEKEILIVKEKIHKYKEQMSKATTNKEYQGFMAEIKYEEDNIATFEEKVIEKMLESDEIMNEIRASEEEFNKISGEYNRKIEDLKKNIEANKKEAANVLKEKEQLVTQIPDNLKNMYETLAKKKSGIAVSLVETEFCGVCNVKIRPQRVNELISSREISFCESCGRILFKKPIVKKEEQDKN
jgi:predicted  nucleic acid-binding Zn-ribbon protein